jgi:hypothetical protein
MLADDIIVADDVMGSFFSRNGEGLSLVSAQGRVFVAMK